MVENLPCNAGGRGSIPGWDQDPTSHGAAEPTCARACTVESPRATTQDPCDSKNTLGAATGTSGSQIKTQKDVSKKPP